MTDIQEQMVQAIEQMKSNFSLYPASESSKAVLPQIDTDDIMNGIMKWGRDNHVGLGTWYCFGDEIDESLICTYCDFLDILEQKEVLYKEDVFDIKPGMQVKDVVEKLDNCYGNGKIQRHGSHENTYLNAIKGCSKEEAQILRVIYPEEMTCSSAIVRDYIINPQSFRYCAELFGEELFATIKSEKLLYYIFWEWDGDDIWEFVKKALVYDKDYFKGYKDELGNNCLHYCLMVFELMQSRYFSNYNEIKSLLLEHGVDPDEKNIGNVSYNDLASYAHGYQEYEYMSHAYCSVLFYEYKRYACNKEMKAYFKNGNMYGWLLMYLVNTPRNRRNPVITKMAEHLGIKAEDIEPSAIDNDREDCLLVGKDLLWQYEDMLYRKDLRTLKEKCAPRHRSRHHAA